MRVCYTQVGIAVNDAGLATIELDMYTNKSYTRTSINNLIAFLFVAIPT
jgi:hypothetical protein